MKLNLGIAPFDYELDFTIPDVDNVGLFLSGGLDSTILLCMIIEELKSTHRTIPIHLWTCNKVPDTEYAARIVDVVNKEYNQDLIYHDNYPVSEAALARSQMDFEMTRVVSKQFDSIELYMGANNSWDKTQWADRMIASDVPKLSWKYPEEPHITYPFLSMLKSQTTDIYYKLNKEHLIKYTYSCSKKEHPRCNTCYSCKDAAQGFDMLNKTRPEFFTL